MQISKDASLYISHRNDGQIVYKNTENTTSISMSGSGYEDYLHATRDGYVEKDGVQLKISDEAKTALEEMFEKWQKMQEKLNEQWVGEANAKHAEQTGEAMEKAFENQAKALEIARRISKGGRVPAIDERKLMEYDDKLYQMSKQAGLMARQHKKYKEALFEDEEPDNTEQEEQPGPDRVDLVMEIPDEMLEAGAEIESLAVEAGVVE